MPTCSECNKTTVSLGRNTLRKERARRKKRQKIDGKASRKQRCPQKRPFRRSWLRLVRFGAALGRSWGALGSLLGALGPQETSSGTLLGAHRTRLGCSWASLGCTLGLMNASKPHFGRFREPLGLNFGGFLGPLAWIWECLWRFRNNQPPATPAHKEAMPRINTRGGFSPPCVEDSAPTSSAVMIVASVALCLLLSFRICQLLNRPLFWRVAAVILPSPHRGRHHHISLHTAVNAAMTTLFYIPPLLLLPFRCGGLCAALGIKFLIRWTQVSLGDKLSELFVIQICKLLYSVGL